MTNDTRQTVVVKLCSLLVNVLLTFVIVPATMATPAVVLQIPAERLIVQNYRKWLNGAGCDAIKSFASVYANRGTVELVLACQALAAGGYPVSMDPVELPNYQRAIVEVKSGRFALSAESVWDIDIDPEAYFATDPVIIDGEFQKGVYALPDSPVHKIKTLAELREFKAVMPRSWVVDWATLENMKLSRSPFDVATKENIFRLLGSRRVDFTLLEFSERADLAHEIENVKLLPVPNVKVTLKGNRRFIVSRKHKDGARIFEALQRGVRLLRRNGTIDRALVESGFINLRTKKWPNIN